MEEKSAPSCSPRRPPPRGEREFPERPRPRPAPPAPSPSRRGCPAPAPAARARRDDLPQQQRQPRGQQQLQDALSQAGEAAAGMPRRGRPPRFTKGASARPDTALLLEGTGLGGDLVPEGGGSRGRLGPVTLAGEMPSSPPGRGAGGDVEEGEGAERRREGSAPGQGLFPALQQVWVPPPPETFVCRRVR